MIHPRMKSIRSGAMEKLVTRSSCSEKSFSSE